MPKRGVTALIDGDILIYQASAAVEHPIDWGNGFWTLHSFMDDAINIFEDMVFDIVKAIGQQYQTDVKTVFALSDTENNFRKNVWPGYKHNRKNKRSPLCRGPLHQYVLNEHQVRTYPTLEADDVLGILMTHHGSSNDCITGQKVLVTIDKDLRTIPGVHYHYIDKTFFTVDKHEADLYFMQQTLTGDTADGYGGCPGIGIATAKKLLKDKQSISEMWPCVMEAYAKCNLPEHYALIMARLARICRYEDYNFKKGEVILWCPPT